jgi:hypothetical protein
MKTIDVNISYVFNINISVLHVSTISSSHHQALMNITQVIKVVGQIWIRILAADGCVAREYVFIYYVYIYNLAYCSLLWYAYKQNRVQIEK